MLERVPFEKARWKPHQKSQELVSLARHIANIPVWINRILASDEFNFADGFAPIPPTNNQEELLALHDKRIKDATEAIEKMPDDDLAKVFTLKNGEHVINSASKLNIIRNMTLNHSVHHRGQLSVYLRELDVPVPGMYGQLRMNL